VTRLSLAMIKNINVDISRPSPKITFQEYADIDFKWELNV